MALSIFYRQCGYVLSPSPASDESLLRIGVERAAIGRWGRGGDTPASTQPCVKPVPTPVISRFCMWGG